MRSAARLLAVSGGYLAGIALLVMALGVTGDVSARYLLGAGTQIAVEVSGYLLVAIIFLGLGYAYINNAHIKVDLFLNMFPPALAKVVSIFNAIVFLVYCLILAGLGFRSVWTSYEFGSTSRTSLDVIVWPFQLLIPLGLLVLIFLLIFEPTAILKSRSGPKGDPPGPAHD